MPQPAFTVQIDGSPVVVSPGTTVAAALWSAGVSWFRTSTGGEPRGPLCGMGICFECRVTIDGLPHRRSCLIACAPGMAIETGRREAAAAAARPQPPSRSRG